MRSQVRISLLAVIASTVLVGVSAPAAQASFGVEKFTATNCKVGAEGCAGEEKAGPFGTPYWIPKSPTVEEAEKKGFTQAGGRVPFGITDFKVNTEGEVPNAKPEGAPVSHVRVDVATGLATAPVAVPMCSMEEFGEHEAVAKTGLYVAPTCKSESEIGVEKVTVYLGPNALGPGISDLPIEGKVYNLEPPQGFASQWGAALALPKPITEAKGLGTTQFYVHAFVKGNVEWGQEPAGTNQGDYHDYFTVEVSTALPLVSARQILYGTRGAGDFITNATSCPGDNTTFVTLENEAKEGPARKPFTTPIGLSGCNEVPFLPSFALTPASFAHDEPIGFTAEAAVPSEPAKPANSQVKTATITLPEGMTLNPSAAAGLEACTPAQARIHSSTPGTSCPKGSELGTVEVEVPTLPAGSLKGSIYLGGPESGPITGPPYVIYLDAESQRYGVSVRIKGETTPSETTGRVTTVFKENPEQPFTNAILHFKGGPLAPIASPLSCGTAVATAGFEPFSGTATKTSESSFSVAGCPSPLPFAWTQSTATVPAKAGASPAFTFNLARNNGQQYLETTRVVLPPGLVGKIPVIPQCAEALANAGTCPAASKIGTVTATAGAGSSPYPFAGNVYLTGPYKGAPYGLSIVVPVVAGPFNLGTEVTRSKIEVEPSTARVVVTTKLPTIKGGVPIRLRSLSVAVTAPNYLLNPTNCGALATESTLTSTFGVTQSLSSPFQVEGCSGLGFKPSFTSASTGRTSKANGASLETTINQAAGQANLKSVVVQLPKQLPSRLTTLQKACLAATFEANPYRCPAGSYVGGARANTPTLPGKMTGPAVLVSHGGGAFPDLDLVLEANGVRVIVVGNTDIKKGITTTSFKTTPDVPVTSVTVNLPVGPHSALAANGNLCASSLVMPTTITGQNGKVVKQNTHIRITNCGVRIAGQKVVGGVAYLTVQTYSAGRISGSGSNLATVFRHLAGAVKTASLRVPLSGSGRSKGRPFSVKVRVGFVPKNRREPTSVAFTTVTFR